MNIQTQTRRVDRLRNSGRPARSGFSTTHHPLLAVHHYRGGKLVKTESFTPVPRSPEEIIVRHPGADCSIHYPKPKANQ